ncbi:MAG: hypothetical protein ABJ084_00630 [Halioglobus sp.]
MKRTRYNTGIVFSILAAIVVMMVSPLGFAQGGFKPPVNLNTNQSTTPSLNDSYTEEAWLVYTYDIGTDGVVANLKIHSSNGVAAVESAITGQVTSLRYSPAMRGDTPVKVTVGPIFYTWILDKPRVMSDAFASQYQEAWDNFGQNDYNAAFDIAAKLRGLPGRNAFEEVKFQTLAASISSRWDDSAAELQHLSRALEFQGLADRNNFDNPYIENGQLLLMMERVHALQLQKMMMGDAGVTLRKIQLLGPGSDVSNRAGAAHDAAMLSFRANPDVTIDGELTPIYRNGPGAWETRLSRNLFSLTNARGKVDSVLLDCLQGNRNLSYPSLEPWKIPPGWSECKLEVSGKAGARFVIHQLGG